MSVYKNAIWSKNTPPSFKQVMNVIQTTVEWQQALSYSNNLVLFFSKPEDDIKHTRLALRPFKEAGIII